jgi:hypothetical protein
MEQTASIKNLLFKHAAKHGFILGIIGILLTVVIYVVDVSFFASLWLLLILLLINLGYAIYAGIDARKEGDGTLSYGNAFLHSFIVFMVATILGRVFSILLFNVIDPDLPETITRISVDKWSEMMAGWGASETDIDNAIEKMREDIPKGFTPGGLLLSVLWPGAVISAFVSLIVALFTKKSPPEVI